MTYKEGDLVKVHGETGEWYGEIVGENEDGQLELFYINRHCKQMCLAVR